MKIIPTYVHGIFDYIGGFMLLFAPQIFGFAEVGGAAVMIPRILGVIVLFQALLTDYELGLFKVLPMKMHVMNDYIAGLFLAASPWLFGFHNYASNVWMPHLIVGLAVFFMTLLTQTIPSRRVAHSTPQA